MRLDGVDICLQRPTIKRMVDTASSYDGGALSSFISCLLSRMYRWYWRLRDSSHARNILMRKFSHCDVVIRQIQIWYRRIVWRLWSPWHPGSYSRLHICGWDAWRERPWDRCGLSGWLFVVDVGHVETMRLKDRVLGEEALDRGFNDFGRDFADRIRCANYLCNNQSLPCCMGCITWYRWYSGRWSAADRSVSQWRILSGDNSVDYALISYWWKSRNNERFARKLRDFSVCKVSKKWCHLPVFSCNGGYRKTRWVSVFK